MLPVLCEVYECTANSNTQISRIQGMLTLLTSKLNHYHQCCWDFVRHVVFRTEHVQAQWIRVFFHPCPLLLDFVHNVVLLT
jgi:hypothetical protein